MLIVDAHLDIAYNALEWDRDLLRPIAKIREAEAGMAQKGRGLNVVNFAELRRGGIGLFFVTMGCRLASMGKRFPGVRTQDIAYARCKGELAYYRLMETGASCARYAIALISTPIWTSGTTIRGRPRWGLSSAWKGRTALWRPNR